MKYRTLMLLVAAALVFVAAGCQNQAPETGMELRVVNHEEVFRQSEAGKESMTYLQGMNEKMMAELTEMQKGQENATEEEQAAAQTRMQGAMNQYRMQLQGEQERIIQALNQAFTKAIEQYRAENDVDMVLSVENVLAYDPEMDVTDEVIATMNAMEIDIEPAEQPQAEPEAETEAREGKSE